MGIGTFDLWDASLEFILIVRFDMGFDSFGTILYFFFFGNPLSEKLDGGDIISVFIFSV